MIQIRAIGFLLICLTWAGDRSFSADRELVFHLKQGKKSLPRLTLDRQSFLPLADLLQLLDLPFSESASAGFFLITSGSNTIKLARGRNIVLVNDQPVALSVSVAYVSNRWLVPPDFIPRVLNRVLMEKIIPAPSGNRYAQGNLVFNRFNLYANSSDQSVLFTLQLAAFQDVEIRREAAQIVCNFGSIPMDPGREDYSYKDSLIQSISFEDLQLGSQLVIRLADLHAHSRITRLSSQNVYLIEIIPAKAGKDGSINDLAPNGSLSGSIKHKGELRRIILDPGHGGQETGIRITETLFEKDLTLVLARKVRSLLQARLGLDVWLTRNTDVGMTLEERVGAAIQSQADIFLSIHIGIGNPTEDFKSFVYALKLDKAEAQDFKLTEIAETGAGVIFLPWDRVQLKSLNMSRRLAEILQGELNQQLNGGDMSLVFRHAPLKILEPLPMPALLLEVGNARAAKFPVWIGQPNVQDALSWALLTALDKFKNRAERP